MKKRYFIVFYTASTNEGMRIGNLSVETKDKYINRNDTSIGIAENIGINVSGVALTNIVEVSQKDYKEYFR